MRLTPDNCTLIGEGLDHPECVALDSSGAVFAGGEAGQVYRLDAGGGFHELGTTGGFLLGIALDGHGRVHACDCGRASVMRIDPDGQVHERSVGTSDHKFAVPNYGVFDAAGNFYVTDSGDYWHRDGTGCILRIAPDDSTSMFHAGPFQFANGLAIDPSGEWLYVVQSTAPNVVRVPLHESQGPIQVTHTLPTGTVPDGIAFASDSRLVIPCYTPDRIYLGHPDGAVELLCEDPTGELLSRPTNVALAAGRMYIANLGGWHLTVIDVDLEPATIHRPQLP